MFEFLFKYPWTLYREGALAFSTRMPAEVRLLLAVAAAVVAYYLYRLTGSKLKVGTRRVLVTLRAMALLCLLLMVLGLSLRLSKVKNEDTFAGLMLDSSRSMTIDDASGRRKRFDAARAVLTGKGDGGGLIGALQDQCALRVFHFANGASRAKNLAVLKPEGDRTNLFRSIRDVEQELRGVPLAVLVLLSDGGHNTKGVPQDIARHLKSRGVKLFAMGFGQAQPPRDYEIVRVGVPRVVRRHTTVDAFATVRYSGYTQPFTVYLARGRNILSTMKVHPQKDREMKRVRFRFYPDKVGRQKYRVFIKPGRGEKITGNNVSEFLVQVKEARLPVLYVEGSPRTEFRFIRRALFRDPDFRLVTILRTGKKRLYVQGADDMPELQKGFPSTKELLFKFEAVILGDIESGFFSKEQLRLLDDFVKTRGGGFAMLGGVNSFNRGGYQQTPVRKLLPVVMDNGRTPYSFARFHVQVPAAALRHPILHQDDDPDANRKIWDTAPELKGYNLVKGVKTGAQVLAYNPLGRCPLLAVQHYGRGRVAAFCTGGSWYWRMSVSTDVEVQEKFWRQLVRWLAVGSKEKVSVTLDRDVYAKGEQVIIRATVLGRSLEAVNDAVVTAKVEDPYGNTEEVEMPWVLTQDGVYQGRYLSREHGDHKVTVHVEVPKLKALEAGSSFTVTRPFVEFNHAGLNEALLKEMTAITGGHYFKETEQDALLHEVKKLLRRGVQANKFVEEKDLWDAPVFFAVLLALLAAEWIVRRRSGLA